MTENQSWQDRLTNRVFAIPAVTQRWAKITARKTERVVDLDDDIPFHPLTKPLSECTFSLITTGGTHLSTQTPFDMLNADGDASFREIPLSASPDDITITHKYYDHRDADRDLNVIFPLEHFHDLSERGVIRGLAPRHFGFMGHIDGPLVADLTQSTAPQVADKLLSDGVDCVFLTPA